METGLIGNIAHIVGFIGMVFVVIAFHNTVTGKWAGQSKIFNVVNLIGATLLLLSLTVHFNLGSFIIEVFWIIISVRGLYAIGKTRARNSN